MGGGGGVILFWTYPYLWCIIVYLWYGGGGVRVIYEDCSSISWQLGPHAFFFWICRAACTYIHLFTPWTTDIKSTYWQIVTFVDALV